MRKPIDLDPEPRRGARKRGNPFAASNTTTRKSRRRRVERWELLHISPCRWQDLDIQEPPESALSGLSIQELVSRYALDFVAWAAQREKLFQNVNEAWLVSPGPS